MTHSTLTRKAARETGIDADVLSSFVDFCELRTRELIAAGHSESDALAIAADEQVEAARALGLF